MPFHFYNTQTRQYEEFKPLQEGLVRIYSCGPTVYDYAHIGNFRSYVFTDLLRRCLKLAGYQVEQALNLTDVDDKTIRGALARQADAGLKELRAHTDIFTNAFFEDLQALNIETFEHYPRATEHIPAMLEIIDRLTEKGYAYEQDGSIYFSIAKDKSYGKLSHIDLSNVKSGTRYRTDEYDKEDIRDFVLWKAEPPQSKMAWDTSYGHGRPGWHIECSAMIRKIFNGPIDIHTGGVDLIFPHHENEIAQSECAYEEKFVAIWMHCEHLLVDGRKMSKSEGNFFTLRDLLKQGHHPAAIRYFLLASHYRQKLNFTFEGLEQALHSLKRIITAWLRVKSCAIGGSDIQLPLRRWREDFLTQLQDDLNMPRALAVVFDAVKEINSALDRQQDKLTDSDKKEVLSLFDYFDRVLGILRYSGDFAAIAEVPPHLSDLLAARNAARAAKNWVEADRLRDKITAAGYKIVDTKEGTRLEKI